MFFPDLKGIRLPLGKGSKQLCVHELIPPAEYARTQGTFFLLESDRFLRSASRAKKQTAEETFVDLVVDKIGFRVQSTNGDNPAGWSVAQS